MSLENHVKHLWDCGLSFDTDTYHKKLLKSYYITTARKLAGKKDTIELNRFYKSQMCERCCTFWYENGIQMKLKPQTINIKTNKARKLIAKLEDQESGKKRGLLSKKQKKRAKWLLKRAASKVQFTCGFCQFKSTAALQKQSKEKRKKRKEKIEDTSSDVKNPTANTLGIENKSITIKKKKKKKKKSTDQQKLIVEASKNAQLVIENTAKVKGKINSKTPPNKKEPSKVQSKTQKQNALLQLAALLKTQDNKNASSSNATKNRLAALLE